MKRLIRLSSWVGRTVIPGGLALVVATTLSGAFAAAPAQAAAAGAGLRIAVVNYGQLIQESPQAKAAVASLRAEFAPKQRTLQTEATQLKAREDTLKKNEATMTQDQRDQAEVELREKYQDLARRQSEIQDDVNTRRNELMSQLQKTLVQVVQSYAKEQRYDLVLADGVIYADGALDITPAILTALKSQGGAARRAPARGK
ncbi:MAG TPA: OmpH family outer membrane protein [Steroidobacteraceae bacterium]|nr:OmpH family outer membrane protein [Steroidobacteraceae bacterium]